MGESFQLWPEGPVFTQSEHFKLGTDSILLADFVNTGSFRRGIDLGCGSGAISVLLLTKSERINMTQIEILPEAAKIAQINITHNNFDSRCNTITDNIKNYKKLFKNESFEFVVSNPPFFPEGNGPSSPKEEKASARSECNCTLDDICMASSYLLKTGGALFMVHKPERLSEIFCTMSRYKIEPKRLRLVQHKPGSAPNLVLVEGRRGGNPGLKIESNLILHNEDNSDTEETKRIYHINGD